jgi:hypothetical protein
VSGQEVTIGRSFFERRCNKYCYIQTKGNEV